MGFSLLHEGLVIKLPFWRVLFLKALILPQILAKNWGADQARFALWLAPCWGTGVAGYFFLPIEPPAWVGGVLVGGLALICGWAWHEKTRWLWLWLPLLMVAGGLVSGQVRTALVAAPVLDKPLPSLEIYGVVAGMEQYRGQWRMTLESVRIPRLAPERTPIRIRLTVRTLADARVGSLVRILARLSPPSQPTVPGGFDFARQAWFARLGAVGFALGAPVVLPAAEPPGWAEQAAWQIERWRLAIDQRLRDGVGGAEGAMASALTTGLRNSIPLDLVQAYQMSGLSHLISISGLHMSLVAGVIFLVLRAAIALMPWVALRWDSKKIAAIGSVMGMAFYLLLSGGEIPALRSFLMGGCVMLAILIDRSALSLRVLSVAAVLVLLLQPDALIGPSFQMSFAAVLGLIAAYELFSPWAGEWRRGKQAQSPRWWSLWGRTVCLYVGGMVLSSVVATIMTAPYAAYHFHRFNAYGVVANLLAIPLASFLVMPGLVAGLLLMPLGLDGLVWPVVKVGLAAIALVAETVSSWPGAALEVPRMSMVDLGLISFGGLWLCLWQGRWRWWGMPLILIGGLMPWTRSPPVLVLGPDMMTVAVHDDQGLRFVGPSPDRFYRRTWEAVWGEGEQRSREQIPLSGGGIARCDGFGCRLERNGRAVAVPLSARAVVEDCLYRQKMLNPTGYYRPECTAQVLLSRARLRENRVTLVFMADNGFLNFETLRDWQGQRPWSPSPRAFSRAAEYDD
ncbi:ComEC/Rec2 family competence protein [Insolitispirillum peregrinum]|uniref:ComEC/Rec2 family competence protein n=1 Tax=Insolitispirillum peregrinum TaxID=80876 RepID=UPI0036D40F9E